MANYASQRAGNWNAPSGTSTSPWYDGGAQTALNSVPGNGDTATIKHAITITGGNPVTVGASALASIGGAGTVSVSGTTITGTGTAFSSGAGLKAGDLIFVGANMAIITVVASDTSLTVASGNLSGSGVSWSYTPAAIAMSGNAARLAVNAPLTVRGAWTNNCGNSAKTDIVTVAAGCGIQIDASQATNPTSQAYPVVLTGGNYQYNRWVFNGTSASRCYFNSNSAGGNGYCTMNGGAHGAYWNAQYTDFARLGSATIDALQSYIDNYAAAEFTLANCTFTGCGRVNEGLAPAYATATLSVTNCTWSGSLGAYCAAFAAGGSTNGGTITGNSFDIEMSVTSQGYLTFSNNILNNGLLGGGTVPFAQFNNNFVRQTFDLMNICGNITNCFLFWDGSTYTNPHWINIVPLTVAGSYNISGNVVYFNGSDPNGNPFTDSANTTVAVNYYVTNNIMMPNAAGLASGAFLGSTSNWSNANTSFYTEHNTLFVEQQWALEIGHLQTTVEGPPRRWGSYKANLCWGSASTGQHAHNDDTTTLQDIIQPSAIANNARYKLQLTQPATSNYANQGNGYCANFSTTPGTSDVSLDASGGPMFVGQSGSLPTLASWDASLGGPGTEADAISQLLAQAPGYTNAALLAYIRAGYRPTNPALTAASYPGDTSVADAAGNPWPGGAPGIGAMASLSMFQPWLYGDQIEANGG